MSQTIQKISPFLWFDQNAEEAVAFYTSIFPNSQIDSITRYTAAGPGPQGSVMTIGFQLSGQKFVAINGGPAFKFTEAVSFVVNCQSQHEVDDYWTKLSAGGQIVECGWLKDKFGLPWQIVPVVLMDMLRDKDEQRVDRVMRAMLKMKKLDIDALQAAYRQS